MSDPENRPQYCICNKHTWLTAISKRAVFECPACRADKLQAQLVNNAVQWTEMTDDPESKPNVHHYVLVTEWIDGWRYVVLKGAQVEVGDWWRPMTGYDVPPWGSP